MAKRIVYGDEPWLPTPYTKAEAAAVQDVANGRGTPEQQKLAIDWIVRRLCGAYDLPYRPGAPDDTDFACGKQHCGQQVVKLINMNPIDLRGEQDVRGTGNGPETSGAEHGSTEQSTTSGKPKPVRRSRKRT